MTDLRISSVTIVLTRSEGRRIRAWYRPVHQGQQLRVQIELGRKYVTDLDRAKTIVRELLAQSVKAVEFEDRT